MQMFSNYYYNSDKEGWTEWFPCFYDETLIFRKWSKNVGKEETGDDEEIFGKRIDKLAWKNKKKQEISRNKSIKHKMREQIWN